MLALYFLKIGRSLGTIMSNPIKSLTKKNGGVWIGSLLIIVISNVSSGSFDLYGFISWKKREK